MDLPLAPGPAEWQRMKATGSRKATAVGIRPKVSPISSSATKTPAKPAAELSRSPSLRPK